jgi:uncharacterized membrane protein (UPF0127 family)
MQAQLWRSAFLFFFSLVFLCGCSRGSSRKVCLGTICLQVELADSELKRHQGLMFRKSLPEKEGMLFVFDQEAPHAFWMKNMYIPLDIIWISQDKRIIDIKTNISPCLGQCENIVPCGPARYVLEVSSGFVNRNAIKVGEQVRF